MPRSGIVALTLFVVALLPVAADSQPAPLSFSLTFLDRFKIEDDNEYVAEPSGLALAREGDALWTVSDDRRKVFKISLEGNPLNRQSFNIGERDLEGITLGPTADTLLVIKEQFDEILKVSLTSKKVVSRHALFDMAGFGSIEQHFTDDVDNKGLEGITFNQDRDSFFLLKERDPGLIIEISRDLNSILGAYRLDAANGFIDDDADAADIDFSGIQYDPSRALFWIVSDQAKRLFLYDLDQDRVLQSAALGYARNGKFREIKQAEGVAIDPRSRRLYVVSDQEARLYVFDLR